MKKITKFIFFPIIFILFSNGCSNSDCGSKDYADLISAVGEVVAQIFAGDEIDIPTTVSNVASALPDCSIAGESDELYDVDFDENNNGSYNKSVLANNYAIPTINGGGKYEAKFTTKFNDPGMYRLITVADNTGKVKESNENNNKSADKYASAGFTSTTNKPTYIQVLPNPNFQKKPGLPQVEVIRYTIIKIK